MRQFVKTGFDVRFQNPLCRPFPGQDDEAFSDGISGGAFPTKAVGIGISHDFRHRVQAQQVQGLTGSVNHGGNAQWPQFAIRFGDVHPPQRLRR